MSHLPTLESFLKDTAKHELKILRDDGVYRHIRFGPPKDSCFHFEIVTWPGYLAYVGDMGAFTFQRLHDMFEFFRRPDHLKESINAPYWAQKLEAVDKADGLKNWDHEAFRTSVKTYVADFLEHCDWSIEPKTALQNEVETEVLDLERDKYNAISALRNFAFKHDDHQFDFEIDDWLVCETYSYRFIWCCYAIVHAIKLYDEAKTPTQA